MTMGTLRAVSAVLLCAICAGLAFELYKELNRQPIAPAINMAKSSSNQLPTNNPPVHSVSFPAISTVSAIIDRPLFFKTRTLPEPPPDLPATPAVKPKLAVTVSGVIITPNYRLALVRDGSSKEVLHLSEGDKVGEWQVAEITKDSVVLQWKDTTEEVVVEDVAPPPARSSERRVREKTAQTKPKTTIVREKGK